MSLGPGYRHRSLDASGTRYTDNGLAATGGLAVGLGSPGGIYWQLGATANHSFKPGVFILGPNMLKVPAFGWDIQSSLGVHF